MLAWKNSVIGPKIPCWLRAALRFPLLFWKKKKNELNRWLLLQPIMKDVLNVTNSLLLYSLLQIQALDSEISASMCQVLYPTLPLGILSDRWVSTSVSMTGFELLPRHAS